MFFSVRTKNLNWEIFRGRIREKPIYRGQLPQKKGLGQFPDLRGAWPGVIKKFFLGGGSMKKCGHDCDQALIKSSWRSVWSIHILVS